MATVFFVFLILVGIVITAFTMTEGVYYFRRRSLRARFRDNQQVLVGINPRANRKAMYETAPMKQQKLSWLVAQNRESIAQGLKQFAVTMDVDNQNERLDTFGIRHSIQRYETYLRKVMRHLRNGTRPIWESTISCVKRTSKIAVRIIRRSPRIILFLIRSIIKIRSKVGEGEGHIGKDDSLR